MSLVETHNALAPSEIQSFLPPLPSSVRLYTPTTIPGRTFERVFGLVRDNMAAMYRRSSMGWSAARKREEMRHPAMRFLVLSSHQATVPGDAKGDVGGVSRAGGVAAEKGEEAGEGEKEAPEGEKEAKEGEEEAPEGEEEAEEGEEEAREGEGEVGVEGFASFMVTEEGGEEVIYCYELHIAGEVRGRGHGQRLMALLEGFGRNVGLRKAMLTVFAENTGAMRLYRRIGYEVDDISPGPRRLRSGEVRVPSYYIFSKQI